MRKPGQQLYGFVKHKGFSEETRIWKEVDQVTSRERQIFQMLQKTEEERLSEAACGFSGLSHGFFVLISRDRGPWYARDLR